MALRITLAGFCLLVVSTPLLAVTQAFETDSLNNAYVGLADSFPAAEYPGVLFTDSDPATGITFVNLTNPVNVGTDISGYYVNVGAFAGQPTFLNLDFAPSISSVSFDFATPSGNLQVFAFPEVGGVIFSAYVGTNTFVNQAGFNVLAGKVSISGLGNLEGILILPAANEALIVDNLVFAPVPEAQKWAMLATGLGLVGFVARRRRR